MGEDNFEVLLYAKQGSNLLNGHTVFIIIIYLRFFLSMSVGFNRIPEPHLVQSADTFFFSGTFLFNTMFKCQSVNVVAELDIPAFK